MLKIQIRSRRSAAESGVVATGTIKTVRGSQEWPRLEKKIPNISNEYGLKDAFYAYEEEPPCRDKKTHISILSMDSMPSRVHGSTNAMREYAQKNGFQNAHQSILFRVFEMLTYEDMVRMQLDCVFVPDSRMTQDYTDTMLYIVTRHKSRTLTVSMVDHLPIRWLPGIKCGVIFRGLK